MFAVLVSVPTFLFSAMQMRNLRVEPEFLKPGEEVTVYVEAVHDYGVFINLAGVFSLANTTWDNDEDYLFLYSGGEGLTALDPPIPQVYAHRYMNPDQTFVGWYEYSWRTTVPATFTEGQMVTLILRGTQQNMPMVTAMNPQDEISITVEVASNKGVAYNTARMGEKIATDKLIIVDVAPTADLTATPPHPGTDTVYIYSTPTLDVDLWTNADSIYYTVDGTDPENDPNAVGIDSTGTVTITGDTVKIWAIAKGALFTPIKKAWIYICELPALKIIADPGDGTHFQIDTTITLTVLFGSDTVTDAGIYYTLDGSAADSTNPNTIVYTGPFTIKRSLTVKGIAYKYGYVPGTGTWTCIRDIIGTQIWAVPDSGTTFGPNLKVSLYTNADSIHYTGDGSDPLVNGVPYTGPFTVSDDISVVKGFAFGDGYDTASGIWIYYRDTVPDVIANPGSCEFTSSVSVELTLSEPWPGAVIYYTLDGSDPDTSGSTTFVYDGTPIIITETTTLKAQACAENAMPSKITTEVYTLVFAVINAWYLDANGDGAIDRAKLEINKETDKLPLEIQFTNPLDASDKKTVSGSQISWLNNDPSTKSIIALFSKPFAYISITDFTTDTYGQVLAGDYSKEPFNINDGVAPVIDKATYCPGKILNNETLKRANDTLVVRFSEEVNPFGIAVIQPFKFVTEEGAFYLIDVQKMSSNKNLVQFLVPEDGIHGVDYPTKGDSIWIDHTFGITDLKNNKQIIENNRHAELKVKPKPVTFVISALVPFIPAKNLSGIPDLDNISDDALQVLLQQGGLVIIVDFLTEVLETENTITCRMEIFDPLGNMVAECPNRRDKSGNLQIGIRQKDNLTQLVIYWTGQNRNGRTAGIGSYLGIINVTLTDLIENSTYFRTTGKVMIGVHEK